jgi:CBS domain containing-hemolysin-like protein
MRLLLDLLLLVLAGNAIVQDKALNILSTKELKRRARAGHDKRAVRLYGLAAYGRRAANWLWLSGAISGGLLLILVVPRTWPSILILSAVVAWMIRGWQPPRTTSNPLFSLAAALAPANSWILAKVGPLLRFGSAGIHLPVLRAKVYEKEDLLELLHDQVSQPDNRIPENELKMAAHALTFGDKKVADIMTPLRKVRLVRSNEEVGPLLMDELHKTGFSRFPVVSGDSSQAQPKIIGTLFLKDIIMHDSGRVHDLMQKKAYFINETQNLREALSAFIKNHFHLFVVVNNFEEIVGVISIEDVLEQIVGQPIVDEFDRYDDLRAVAGLEAKKESLNHNKVPVAPPAE